MINLRDRLEYYKPEQEEAQAQEGQKVQEEDIFNGGQIHFGNDEVRIFSPTFEHVGGIVNDLVIASSGNFNITFEQPGELYFDASQSLDFSGSFISHNNFVIDYGSDESEFNYNSIRTWNIGPSSRQDQVTVEEDYGTLTIRNFNPIIHNGDMTITLVLLNQILQETISVSGVNKTVYEYLGELREHGAY